MKKIFIIEIIAVFFCCYCSYAQEEIKKAYASRPPNFLALHYDEASSAVDIVEKLNLKPSPQYISQIVYQIRDPNISNEGKVFACYLLGCFHSTNADSIQILIDNVDLKALRLDLALRIRRFGDYPAQEALVKIGSATVKPVLKDIPNETKALRIHLLCDALLRVESYEKGHLDEAKVKVLAQNQIKKMISNEKDSDKRANLTAALKELEKIN